ncbi:hypothetical protein [Sphingomonas sp. Marseille-Q8236]
MRRALAERVGGTIEVLKPIADRDTLVDGEGGLRFLKGDEVRRCFANDPVDLVGRQQAALTNELGDAAGARRCSTTTEHGTPPEPVDIAQPGLRPRFHENDDPQFRDGEFHHLVGLDAAAEELCRH